ncbi:serine/threonine-protein kinase [Nonomuraea cypriaca]|uniref:serine/threonine-protein kinase n=1 Tax=Nonomuraea cypriaca TaxID=1187855 RepID=UPI002E2881FF|nr:serine/threonine-protein kinase [Nonomuraea cypriaca]
MSEYVDGPSLAQVLRDRGPLRGAELRRLAIGTLTALSAIHQAGVVHRDFKPGNVLLSRDGPRVIDFGISRALEETEQTGEHLVGTPPYMAPEQFAGRVAGPPADLFAWGSTMVCAATGQPPFGTRELAAVVNRIMSGEPDLGELDGELRELVARCLAKDPDVRPSATEALLALLGHQVPEQRLLAEGQQVAVPPARRRWPLVAGAVVTALAVVVAVLLTRPQPEPPARPAPVPPTPLAGPLALASSAELKLPDTGITLYENPADPVWVSSYHDQRSGGGFESYVRDPATGTFAHFGTLQEPVVSPGGGYVASLSGTRVRRLDFETIVLRDRVTGRNGEIRTVDKPDSLLLPRWSPDGRRLLATVYEVGESSSEVTGFLVLDAAARTTMITEAPGEGEGGFEWGSDGRTVLRGSGGAVRKLDLGGRLVAEFPGVGELVAGGGSRGSLGTVFATICPDKSGNVCLWDEGSGGKRGTVRMPEGSRFHGWLDDGHALAALRDGEHAKLVMLDQDGRDVRTLAGGPAAELDAVTLWFTRR